MQNVKQAITKLLFKSPQGLGLLIVSSVLLQRVTCYNRERSPLLYKIMHKKKKKKIKRASSNLETHDSL